MILEFSQLGFIGVPAPLPNWPDQNLSSPLLPLSSASSAPCPVPKPRSGSEPFLESARCSPSLTYIPACPSASHKMFGLTSPSALFLPAPRLQPARGFAIGPSPESPRGIKRM